MPEPRVFNGVDTPLEHLLGVALGADRRHDEHAAVVQLPDQRLLGRLGEARHLHLLVDEELDAIADVGGVGAQVHAERVGRALLDVRDGAAQLTEVHGGAGDEPEAAGGRGGRGEPRARHPAHAGLHDRVLDADQFAEAGVQSSVHGRQPGTSWLRMPLGSRRAITSVSSGVGGRVSSTVSASASSKPVAVTTSSTVTPGWTLRSRMW